MITTIICMLPASFSFAYIGYAGREAAKDIGSLVVHGSIVFGIIVLLPFLPKDIFKKI